MSDGGKAFQFTPFGIVDHLGAVAGDNTERATTITMNVAPSVDTAQRRVQDPIAASVPANAKGLGPNGVIKAAKARVQIIRAELRRMKSLQTELNQLERLLAAAKQKPVTLVRTAQNLK